MASPTIPPSGERGRAQAQAQAQVSDAGASEADPSAPAPPSNASDRSAPLGSPPLPPSSLSPSAHKAPRSPSSAPQAPATRSVDPSSSSAAAAPPASADTTPTTAPASALAIANRNASREPATSVPWSSSARNSSAMPPTVQFDEQNLLASPAFQRDRTAASNASDANLASPGTSPRFTLLSLGGAALDQVRSPASSVSKRSRLQQRRENGGSLALSNRSRCDSSNSQGVSPRPTGGSVNSSTLGKRRNRSVITVPTWARDESPSPPLSPKSGNLTPSASRSLGERTGAPSPQLAPRLDRDGGAGDGTVPSQDARDVAATEATSTWPTATGQVHNITDEPGETTAETPDRWWTFTLPQKYRTRLHEHHLKMAFHHQRLKDNAEAAVAEAAAARPTPQRSGSGPKVKLPRKKRTNSSHDESVDSDYESDNGEEDGRRGRYFEDGLAGYSQDGAAARLGESGLLDWRHGGRRPSTLEKRSSSQSADRTLTNKRGSGGHSSFADAANGSGDEKRRSDNGVDLEKQKRPPSPSSLEGQGTEYPTLSFKARMEHPDVYTVHQPATPGWASPWRPEERSGGHSIEIDGYRFRPNGMGYFPRTETGRSRGSRGRRRLWLEWWKNFIIHNPFVPLLIRIVNISFTTATLAVAIKLWRVLHQERATDAVGSSPMVAIVFAPLTLVHIAFQIWLEYFGRPIGLWTVQSKLFYTTIEIIFICFWSAELSLSFDNYFTSTLVCVSFGSPFGGSDHGLDPQPLLDMSRKPYICRLQGVLIGLTFVSLLAYVMVLMVSLFRIFVRVTGGRR
ncbi:hypothetical protein ACQY0O_007549 [Thecaphora frezii]